MRTRTLDLRIVSALLAALVLTACADADPAPTGTVASDPVTTERSTSATGRSSATHEPSEPAGGTTEPDAVGDIPDDFPLVAGWPRRPDGDRLGLTGPNRTLSGIEHAPCDRPVADPDLVDRLRAEWNGPEDHRSRQLTTYRNPSAAAAAVQSIVRVFRECPEFSHDGGFTARYDVAVTSYGDESWSVTATETQAGGYPTASLVVRHLVRVGRAVLVTYDYNEGGAAPPGRLDGFVRAPGAAAAAVIAAMCAFTTAGC